jgi:hypothetical protein
MREYIFARNASRAVDDRVGVVPDGCSIGSGKDHAAHG